METSATCARVHFTYLSRFHTGFYAGGITGGGSTSCGCGCNHTRFHAGGGITIGGCIYMYMYMYVFGHDTGTTCTLKIAQMD